MESSNGKVILKGQTLKELKEFFIKNELERFRGQQLFNWMYNHLVTDFDEMSSIPKLIRNKLKEETEIVTLKFIDSEVSNFNNTKKYIFETAEENKIESVIIPDENRVTLCLSTQVGCPLDCKFCATGLMGYKKNLTSGEIFDQYLLTAKDYGADKITNIVYMGMGEPLLNFKETVRSLEIFAEDLTTGISLKKITISTAGIAPKIKELAETGLNVKLALSLHSCFEDIRSKIMPINEKYSLKANLDAIRYYARKTKTRITFEYVMLKDINDRPEDIAAITRLCSGVASKINIIPFNSLKHMNPEGLAGELEPTPQDKIQDFVQQLRDKNITVMVRNTMGDDIAAACGQLAIKY